MRNIPIPVKLDRDRRVSWSNSATYRMGLIKLHTENTYGLIVQLIWAALVPDDATAFPTPEHMAEYVPIEKINEYVEVVNKLTAQIGKKKSTGKETEAEAKNGDGSTD